MYTFNICDKNIRSVKGIEHIHPRKQRDVAKILKKIKPISIFGSATRPDCNEKSDIDILLDSTKIGVTKKEAYDLICEAINTPFDLLWYDDVIKNASVYQKENIIDKAVTLC